MRYWLFTLSIMLRWSFKMLIFACISVFVRIMWWWNPHNRQQFAEVMNEMAHMNMSDLDMNDWQDKFFTWQQMKQEAKRVLLDFYKEVKLGGPAIDVDVITLEGNEAKLLDYSSDPERPFVVNLGSCT